MKKQYGLVLLIAAFLVISSIGVGMSVIDRASPLVVEDDETCVYDITVFKYYDVNGNGMFEEGVDYPLEGWYFELYGKHVETEGDDRDHPPWFYLDEGYTDSEGYLIFEDYECGAPPGPAGHYKVREYIPDGWYNTGSAVYPTGNENNLNVVDDGYGESYVEDSFWLRVPMTVEFGNALLDGDITVYKFHDIDMTGEYDPEIDYMLEDWMFNLWTIDDGEPHEIIASDVTDADGQLVFENVTPGDYIVQEILKENWENTNDLLQPVTVYPGQSSEVWFGNIELGDITVYKFYDSNYDGNWYEEELIDGFQFQLWSADEDGNPIETIGEPVDTMEGMYTFEGLYPGHYIVQELIPDVEDECCWVSTTGELRYIELMPGEMANLWFGNVRGGRIEGMKFLDIEADGHFDVGLDKPLMGWQINLWTNVDGYPGEIIDTTYTDRSGEYYFDCVVPGAYFVQEEMYEGWYNVTPAVVPVYVEPCETVDGIDFANCMYKDIYGIKFYDYSMTGEFDPEVDWVLEGWEIRLLNSEYEVIDIFYTLPNGYYFFEGLTVGTYYVEEVLPEGWVSTTPTQVEVVLNCCTPCTVVNFGNYELPEVTIYKFYDVDMDGIYDPEVDYLLEEGVMFNVFGDLGGDIFVDFDIEVFGMFNFITDVGYYRITEDLPEGWINTTPLVQDNTLAPGDHWTVYFGNVQYGDLTVYKFYDVEMTGEYDEEMDELLEGWTFDLWTTEDGSPYEVIATNVTGEDGYAMFLNLEPGYYAVQEITQECWFPTTDVVQFVEISPGETSELWFGNVPGANIEGYKFCDYNLNQEFDDHECGLEGWDIHLYEYPNNDETPQDSLPYMSTTTDEYGYYEFTCVRPGWYILVEEMQDGWYNSTPYYYIIEVLPEDELRYDFGNYRHGDIYGLKYCDFNMNGEFDECLDWPLYGWEIQLWSADEHGNPIELIDTTYTDNWGMYRFEDLGPGDYVVAEVLKPCGWINTTDMEVHVRLGCVEEVEVNFGNYRPSNISVKAYDYEMNEPVAGLVLYLWEADEYGTPIGEEPIAEGITGPHGYYIFPTYDPGYYIVQTADGYHSEFVILRCSTAYVVFEYYDYGYEETPQMYISKAEYVKLA